MIPVINAYADFIARKSVAHIFDDFYVKNSRILEYSVSLEYMNNLTTWNISFFSRY